MIARLYERITGKPWTTVRSATAEFGPPPGAVYAEQLSGYSDAELLAHGDRILAQLRQEEATGGRNAARTAGVDHGNGSDAVQPRPVVTGR